MSVDWPQLSGRAPAVRAPDANGAPDLRLDALDAALEACGTQRSAEARRLDADLTALCVSYIVHYLRDGGVRVDPGQRTTPTPTSTASAI